MLVYPMKQEACHASEVSRFWHAACISSSEYSTEGDSMSLLITVLQVLGVIVLALIAIGFAARKTIGARAAKESDPASRIGVEAPTNYDETGR